MGFPFWDDPGLINGEEFGGNTIAAALTHSLGNYYRPLTSLSFVVDTIYAKGNPFFYHQTNILFHAFTAVLISCLALLITKSRVAGILSGAFFAAQPLQLGAAAWIGGRTDVLSSFFLLGFVTALVLYLRSPKPGWLVVSVVSFVLAALAKEQAIAILPVIPLSVFVFGSGKWKDAGKLCIPFGTVTVLYLLLWVTHAPLPPAAHNTLIGTVTLALRTAAFYGLGLLVPNRPSLVTFTLENYATVPWILFGAVLVAVGALLLRMAWQRNRPVAFIAVCALLVYIPISNFPTIPSMVIASYRLGESGAFAACLFGILGAWALSTKRQALGWILGGNLVLGLAVTWWGVHLWLTPMTFFSHVARTDPHFIVGDQFYAKVLETAGRTAEAEACTAKTVDWIFGTPNWIDLIQRKRSLAIDEDVMQRLRTNLGVPVIPAVGTFIGEDAFYLARLNQMEKAQHIAADALVIAPRDPWLNYLYGRMTLHTDRRKAIGYWRTAMMLAPGYADCAASLAHELVVDKQFREAATLLDKALEPGDYRGGAWLDLADAKIALGDPSGATAALDNAEKALFAPAKADIQKRRGTIRSLRR